MSTICPGSGEPLETTLDGDIVVTWCCVCKRVTLAADRSLELRSPKEALHGAAADEHELRSYGAALNAANTTRRPQRCHDRYDGLVTVHPE